MALGVISPGFIKRSTSQSLSSPDQQLQPPKQRATQTSGNTRRTKSLSSQTPPTHPQQLQIPKQRNLSKPFNTRRTQSLSAPTQDTTPEDQAATRHLETTRRSQSCSFSLAKEGDMPRSRSTSLQESLKVDDRARTFGGVPGTELTVTGRQFWRSVLGSAARVRER